MSITFFVIFLFMFQMTLYDCQFAQVVVYCLVLWNLGRFGKKFNLYTRTACVCVFQ